MKLNLFKSKHNKTVEEEVLITNKSTYSPDIEQIHHEFEVASDKLVEQANEIIKEAKKQDINKVNRLKALGFNNSNQVRDIEPLIQQEKLSKEQLELVQYYKKEYPLNKFITEPQVKEICHKYNLVCGDVDRYKGFVPDKNLKEIENFKLKEKDIPFYLGRCRYSGIIISLDKADFTPTGLDYVKESDFFLVGSEGQNIYGSRIVTSKCIEKYSHLRNIYLRRIDNQKLQICAPIKDMDISGLELKEGYKLENKHIPDPVVLQPVKGGYLILTAWGDEASDPIVQNEINN